jgi:hypothetical protein
MLPATETLHQQEVAPPTPLAIESFIPEDTALNSTKSTANTSTEPILQCNVATASIENMQAEIHHVEQLEQCQPIKEKIIILYSNVCLNAAKENCAMVAQLAQAVSQAQTGQAVEVPTIAMHVAGPSLPDTPMMSMATTAALLGHGASGITIAGALPLASLAFYHLAYLYPLLSGCVQVPGPCLFKAKNILE